MAGTASASSFGALLEKSSRKAQNLTASSILVSRVTRVPMSKIKPIGSYLGLDESGYIINPASLEKVQERYLPVIEEVKQEYIKHFGANLHSIYLRGSVAKGEAIENVSDIDSFAIVSLKNAEIDTDWTSAFNQSLVASHPFITGVEIVVIPMGELEGCSGDKIMIKTQSICIYGESISDALPLMKPGKDIAQHVKGIEREIEKTKAWLEGSHAEEEIKQKCIWIMKRVLRSGFELVMEDLQKYTRDIYCCYHGFSEVYPEKKEAMYQVLELAVEPTLDKSKILGVLDGIEKWLKKEIRKKF